VDRLILFIKEGEIHSQKIKKALNKLPKTIRNIEEYEETLDSLAFRFSRLQGLLGEKIFKEYLNFTLRDTEGKDFLEILRMLEKEGILNIEEWREFRKIRNFIFHDYPLDEEEKLEAINFLINNSRKLITIFETIKAKVEAHTRRD